MATEIVQAPSGADHTGECSARTGRGLRTPTGDYMTCAGGHAPGDQHGAGFGKTGWFSWSDDTDTAPLPAPAADAASRIAAHFPLIEAVAVYETASVHVVQLAALAESGGLSDLDADSLAHAEDLMAGAKATLAAAGRLDLIGVQ